MNYSGVYQSIKLGIQKQCPQLPEEIVDEFLDFTVFRSNWVTYGNDQHLYVLGIVENRYDFYYIGCDDNDEIKTISCALDIKKCKERENNYLCIWQSGDEFRESIDRWNIVKRNIEEYLEKFPDDKLIYFQDMTITN